MTRLTSTLFSGMLTGATFNCGVTHPPSSPCHRWWCDAHATIPVSQTGDGDHVFALRADSRPQRA